MSQELRRLTRDRLAPQFCRSPINGQCMIYPWENSELSFLQQQLYQLATDKGFSGSIEDFWTLIFNGTIVRGSIEDFPAPGNEELLYLDENTGFVYYFSVVDNEKVPLLVEEGAASKGEADEENKTYIYIPIKTNAGFLNDVIIDGGEA